MDAFGMGVLRGNTADRAAIYRAWLGRQPSIQPMLKERGLLNTDS
jgi:Zn-dependent oligopeptidase